MSCSSPAHDRQAKFLQHQSDGPSWSEMLSGVQRLTVLHFRPRDVEALTICDFMTPLESIQRLLDLTIVDLQIDMSESPLASYDDIQEVDLSELEYLHLRNLKCFEPIDTLLSFVGTSHVEQRLNRRLSPVA